MLCLGDCPKTIKSLPYNHLGINNFEFLKYLFYFFFYSSDVRYVQVVINEIRHKMDIYIIFKLISKTMVVLYVVA